MDPFPVHSLALEALQKGEDRIQARRARNEARSRKFHELGKKTKGVDVEALNKQVAENASKRDDEKELDRQYARIAEQVSLIVEERRMEEDQARKAQLRDLKEDWDAHAALPKNQYSKIAPSASEKAGLASAQKFASGNAMKAALARLAIVVLASGRVCVRRVDAAEKENSG